MITESLKESIQSLPDNPGVYRYYNEHKELIYVGKAKDIRKRVTSYFSRTETLNKKTQKLVSQISYLEYTIVPTEFDALLLENNLIKEHQPKYNILLRDDKTYPYILLTNEPFPRIETVRNVDKKRGQHFGPYTSLTAMNNVVELVNKLFQLRTCTLQLHEKNIAEKKFKICLEYHIGNCKGPCEGLEAESDYLEKIKQVINILKGNVSPAKLYFKSQMIEAATNLAYEKADYYKTKLESLERFHSNSVIVSNTIDNVSVYTINSDENYAAINYFKIINGQILQSKTIDIKKKLNEEDDELLTRAIISIRQQLEDDSTEIITNIEITYPDETLTLIVPQKGDKKKLLTISLKNSMHRLEKINRLNIDESTNRVLETLKKDLSLKDLPEHIECFDNSNFQGTDAVSAMVCFKNGKPSKKDYRHFNVKTVVGPNDFATMYEVITRRYKHCIEENVPFPNLIIVDGGKGQLSSAVMALTDLGIYGKIPIIGIAKNLEEIFFPEDSFPLYIDKKSESLRLIQFLRDEAHRFGITHHRNKRSKTSIRSEFENIPQIGQATIDKLLQHFKSVKAVKESAEESIAEIVGVDKARKIKAYFESK